MSRGFWIGGVVAAVLAAGGVAAWQLRAEDKDEAAERARPERSVKRDAQARKPSAADRTLEQRIARLEGKVALLERQRDMARLLANDGDDQAQAGGTASATIDDPVFELAVRDVVERVGSERVEQQRAARTQRMERWAQRWADQVSASVGLSDAQKAKVTQIVGEHIATMVRARDEAETADAGNFRERRRTMREALDKQLSQVLTPAQTQRLETLRESGELPGLFGRRGRARD